MLVKKISKQLEEENQEIALAENPKKDQVRVTYHKGTKIKKSVVRYVDGQRDGLSRSFYKDGKKHMEIEYVDGQKHGVSKQYNKDGSLYKEAFYDDGYVYQRKFYHKNGQLKADETYVDGEPTIHLKEYLKSGKQKSQYPEILVTMNNDTKDYNKVVLELNLDVRRKNTKFFLVKDESKEVITAEEWNPNLSFVQMYGHRGVVEIPLPKNSYIDKVVPIYVRYTTLYGRQRIDKIDYHLKVKNI
ncbi:hypothetical protein KMW28_20190 [Flammeovirga yaeyamensis]|uniref:Uncharacterized protein n=1 Tax=Flammeovirga yaeyamensis TaxID=367791 RepID=A0AAX1N3M6_9BACT|nr:hypothetical protein [Flammeovirga yaeyamensis]MBB3701011.1 antitoxin component YwqK of YwqJK toxin-antitoxin module [Flammeovirga yaeyamensis]NMF38155.1 hypothetical protein [Flammeovirga yaeyamensis]QWG01926.1 hypothetical protein KMW28_20190 [Flammeovirga yaeyamensis]